MQQSCAQYPVYIETSNFFMPCALQVSCGMAPFIGRH